MHSLRMFVYRSSVPDTFICIPNVPTEPPGFPIARLRTYQRLRFIPVLWASSI